MARTCYSWSQTTGGEKGPCDTIYASQVFANLIHGVLCPVPLHAWTTSFWVEIGMLQKRKTALLLEGHGLPWCRPLVLLFHTLPCYDLGYIVYSNKQIVSVLVLWLVITFTYKSMCLFRNPVRLGAHIFRFRYRCPVTFYKYIFALITRVIKEK